MPQLSGPEQKVLVDLLIGHLTEPAQLDRALLHSGLGNLSMFTQQGTLPAQTSEIVRTLSCQYRVVEFVEAVLQGDFLMGHCPPIVVWLNAHRIELMRRRDRPTLVERIQRFVGQLQEVRWWLLSPVIGLVLAVAFFALPPSVRAPIGPLAGQLFSLQQSLSTLTTINNSRPTRGTEELHAAVFALADDGEFGVVLLAKPLEQSIENPTIEVRATDVDGNSLEDRDGLIEIHCLPPDRDRESQGRWSPKLHLKDGVASDTYDGMLMAGSIITVVYHRKEPREAQPSFSLWLK